MKKAVSLILVLCLSVSLFASCKAEKEEDGKILLVTSFYPIYIFTLNITNGIDEIKTECMAESNVGCLHDYQLLSKDAKLVSDASAFIINGAGMELFLEDIYNSHKDLPVIDSSLNVHLIEECEEHSHNEEVSDHHAHNHSVNSHIWLSVNNAVIQVENICDGLIKLYPEYENELKINTESYIERLEALKESLQKESVALKGKKIITFHEAFDYLAEDYSFIISETVTSHDGGEPSSKRLAHLSDVIKAENIKTLFVEVNSAGSAAEILKNETEAVICQLNPVTSGDKTLTSYEDIMKENMKSIVKAVG